MNPFLASTKKLIDLHGDTCTYKVVNEGAYNIETGSTANTETSYSVVMYKKHLVANQYNFPDLIGKDSAIFYLANNSLSFSPNINDKVLFNTETYTVQSIVKHSARGDVVLFKILAVKG
jgi:hypothetical protein